MAGGSEVQVAKLWPATRVTRAPRASPPGIFRGSHCAYRSQGNEGKEDQGAEHLVECLGGAVGADLLGGAKVQATTAATFDRDAMAQRTDADETRASIQQASV